MKTHKISFLVLFALSFGFKSECQIVNQKLINEKTGEEMLIGPCTRDAFLTGNYQSWFRKEYSEYGSYIKTRPLDSISKSMSDISVTIVLGTWCSDSKREIPRMLRILDYLKFDNNKLKIYCVDLNKQCFSGETDSLNIILVPTIIIFRSGKEIGRIIETPIENLERDLMKIILKKEDE